MPVGPFSRYRNLPVLEVKDGIRGATRCLPIRRPQGHPFPKDGLQHRFSGYEALDFLSLKYFGREELYWYLMDANSGRLPESFKPGEMLVIPPLNLATRIKIPGR